MTPAQVTELENAVQKNPEDLTTRQKLMGFYQSVGKQVLGEEQTRAAFRRHKQWMVQHHPDNEAASYGNPVPDAEGDSQTKKLWLAAIERPNAPAAVFDHAASFFGNIDKALAVKLLERAQALDPKRSRSASGWADSTPRSSLSRMIPYAAGRSARFSRSPGTPSCSPR